MKKVCLMTVVVTLLLGQVDWLIPGSFVTRFALLGSAVFCGFLTYAFCLWLFGVKEMQQAWALLSQKFSLSQRNG